MYALRLDNGTVVTDPEWRCPADVMKSFTAFGTRKAYGTLVFRKNPHSEWQEYDHV